MGEVLAPGVWSIEWFLFFPSSGKCKALTRMQIALVLSISSVA
jgi:hypothetical protein